MLIVCKYNTTHYFCSDATANSSQHINTTHTLRKLNLTELVRKITLGPVMCGGKILYVPARHILLLWYSREQPNSKHKGLDFEAEKLK